MSRVILSFAAILLLITSAQAADSVVTGRSASVATSSTEAHSARRAWFKQAVDDIIEGRVRSKRDGSER